MRNKGVVILSAIVVVLGVTLAGIGAYNGAPIPEGMSGYSIKSDFPEEGFVSKVIDGDTVIIEGESVRLLGMDTDERGYPCYNAAKKRIEELLLDKKVNLELDGEDKDRYGRYLRFIFLDAENINLKMVEEGLAVSRFSPKNKKYKEEILSAEREARESKRGCKWGEPDKNPEREEPPAEKKESTQVNTASDLNEELTKEEPEGEYICDSNEYNCGDFATQEEAQAVFEACGGPKTDIHKLDSNKDGKVCESLP